MATTISDHGLAVSLPSSWEGRIYVRPQPAAVASLTGPAAPIRPLGSNGYPGEVSRPIVHLGNFALPAERGDYGSGAVDVMRGHHIFVSVMEFGPESVGTALFSHQGVPQPAAHEFGPNTLQRRLPNQLGYQRFFTFGGRAFCAFVVLGHQANVRPLSATARAVLATLEVRK